MIVKSETPSAGARAFLPLLLCALVMCIDGYDLYALPLVVPHLSAQLGLSLIHI